MLPDKFRKAKWSTFHDEIIRARVYWLGPWRELTTVSGHGVMIFADRVYDGYRTRTRYTARVACGPCGEHAYESTLPFGRTIADAKAEALKLVEAALADGYTIED